MSAFPHLLDLPAFGDGTSVNGVIETPRGCRNKYKFDGKRGLFLLKGVLPAGAVFPFDFGFIPSTRGEDGDPLDILVLMDEPAFPGCLVEVRMLGAIEAEQTERDGTVERNDRLIGVAAESRTHRDMNTLSSLGDVLLEEIEHFFISYNEIKGKTFAPLGRVGSRKAASLVRAALR